MSGLRPVTAQPRNGLPVARGYRWRDPDAGREAQVQAALAAIRAELGGEADVGPGPEWYRELEAERQELAAPAPAQAAPPAPVITLPALPAAVPAIPAPAPAPAAPRQPEPAPEPQYHKACGYLTSAIGHKITCGPS